MNKSVIIMILVSSVIYLKSADFPVCKSCYKLHNSWKYIAWSDILDDYIFCETQCKGASENYLYYGTFLNKCFCGKNRPVASNKSGKNNCTQCPGDPQETCGGQSDYQWLMSFSKLDTPMNMTNTCTSSATEPRSTSLNTTYSTTTTTENTKNSLTQTTTHATTDILSSTAGGMRPRKLLCKCPKRLINKKWHFLDGKNITDDEVRKMVVEDFNKNIKPEISVDKKTVSKEVRKKNSSVNKRKSSQSIGSGCVVFLVLPVVFLIAIDILNCCIHFQSRIGDRKRHRIGPTSDIQDSRDSSKPLHENVNITGSCYASNDFHPDEVKLETHRRRRDDNNDEDRDEWLQYM